MKTFTLLSWLALASGCLGVKVRVFGSAEHAPSTVAITPLTLDRFSPDGAIHERGVGDDESRLLAEGARAVGAKVVDLNQADCILGGTVQRAVVGEWAPFEFNTHPSPNHGVYFA